MDDGREVERRQLPAAVQPLLEEQVSGRGFFGVLIADHPEEGRALGEVVGPGGLALVAVLAHDLPPVGGSTR